ncbi:MAG: spermine/spermidine synthase domain-containing protein [Nitrospirota bacterium]
MDRKFYRRILMLFTLSGFTGLIYESIWTHYLKLFLGHAAYAQTLVVTIFMGGLALGSWICSRHSSRWTGLLRGYALAEGLIGLFAMAFHTVFDAAVQTSYGEIIPLVGNPAAVTAFKWSLSVLLILPQSVLLGMTFPLMSSGVIRLMPLSPGRAIAMLYFVNSLGAAAGVIASGFLLIQVFGMPGTIRIAGLLNILLALGVWLLVRNTAEAGHRPENAAGRTPAGAAPGRYALLLAVSCITGASSFMYEIGWIRMLSLVLGASTHAFELMLSAFILGIAFGGLWIHSRIDRIGSPERSLAFIQVSMGILALLTLPLYGLSFDAMKMLLQVLDKTNGGYALFNLGSNAIALAIMLPATFCAGMTLPLITVALLRQGQGERSIGAVYAANTAGAIAGVFFAVHLGLPGLGLKGLILFGASCDIALGALLLWSAAGYASIRTPALASAAGAIAVLLSALLVELDPSILSSGVYRMGTMLSPETTALEFYKDGKTSTITVHRDKASGAVAIATNGKPDASMRVSLGMPATSDEPTMLLLGILPMALNPRAETAATIGLGSGLTTQILLHNPGLKQVDTIEIEEAVVEAAQRFRPRVERVFTDPRSALFIDDAKTYFTSHRKQYDIIISEPSNPWVSGVAGLFSAEFYRVVSRHLAAEGVFVQWVQLYEIDVALVMSILKAVSGEFSDYALYTAGVADMMIVGKKEGVLPPLDARVLAIPALAAELQRVHIRTLQDIEIRKIGGKALMRRLSATFDVPANSDYYPVVDQNAVRSRFLQENAFAVRGLAHDWLPVMSLLAGARPGWRETDVTLSPYVPESEPAYAAMVMRDHVLRGKVRPARGSPPPAVLRQAIELRRVFHDCRASQDREATRTSLFRAAVTMIPYLTPDELSAVWTKLEAGPCAASFAPDEKKRIALYKAVGRRDADTMAGIADELLAGSGAMPPEARSFTVASGMTGHLLRGERDEAFQLWSDNSERLSPEAQPGLLFRFLVAESVDAQ